MNNEIRNESQALPESIRCVGADDLTLSLFENQYPVQPMGVSYNSYLILDEKIAVMDSVDARAADEWLAKLAHELDGRSPTTSLSPTWSRTTPAASCALRSGILKCSLSATPKPSRCSASSSARKHRQTTALLEVGEGETAPLGAHTLHFMLAPMVHWPEVMVTYEETEKLLFSADAFRALRLAGAPPTRRGHRRRGATTTTLSASTARRCRRC